MKKSYNLLIFNILNDILVKRQSHFFVLLWQLLLPIKYAAVNLHGMATKQGIFAALTTLVLCCFILSSGGTFVVLELVKHNAQKEVETAIAEGKLRDEIITLNFAFCEVDNQLGGFKWEVFGKEFKYNNLLYDVVNIDATDNEYLINCINDKTEEKITALISQELSFLFAENIDKQHNSPLKLIKGLDYNYTYTSANTILPLDYVITVYIQFCASVKNRFSQEILLPPPQSLG